MADMRFLRYVFKQKAVNEICDMIAPSDQFTVVGFWRLERSRRDMYQAPLLWASSGHYI
jgi:hypothetical protein